MCLDFALIHSSDFKSVGLWTIGKVINTEMKNTQQVDINVLASGLNFPEGPAFAGDGSLWAVELNGGCLIQYKDGLIFRYQVGGGPNGIAINTDDKIFYCDALNGAVNVFDPNSGTIRLVTNAVNGSLLTKPNDLAFDLEGNLVFSCPGNSRQDPSGYVCVTTKSGLTKRIASGLYFPNGLCFTDSGQSLVIAETYRHRLWKGDWNSETCEWINQHVWADVGGPEGPGGPDGIARNNDGVIYVAVYGTGKIKAISSEGNIVDELTMPGKNPTNCVFDPKGKLGLIVTEAEHGILASVIF